MLVWFWFLPAESHAYCAQLKAPHQKLELKYAQHFSVDLYSNFKLVSINLPGKNEKYQFVVIDSKQSKLESCQLAHLKLPIKKIVAASATHIPILNLLNEAHSLVGFGDTRLLYDPVQRERLRTKALTDVGYPLSLEQTLKLKPDLVLAYLIADTKLEGWDKFEKLKVPLLFIQEFKESSPLARVEWIKLFGLLFDKQALAQKIFNEIETDYLKHKALVATEKAKPTVLIGYSTPAAWDAPGGTSDFAQLVADAGGAYLWSGYKQRAPLNLNFEKALGEGGASQVWLPQNSWRDRAELLLANPRYKNFKSVQAQAVYNFNNKTNDLGGNDYWETGLMRPDLLLKDLIRIFHPSLLPKHQLIWYQKL